MTSVKVFLKSGNRKQNMENEGYFSLKKSAMPQSRNLWRWDGGQRTHLNVLICTIDNYGFFLNFVFKIRKLFISS